MDVELVGDRADDVFAFVPAGGSLEDEEEEFELDPDPAEELPDESAPGAAGGGNGSKRDDL